MDRLPLPQGVNFSSNDLPAPALAQALCRTAAFLQSIEPHGAELHHYDDWWEHDGLHFRKGTISIHDLFQMVNSPRSLLTATPAEERVSVGVASADTRWYLRFHLSWNDEGYELSGRYDITLPAELASQYRADVIECLGLELREQIASAYYSSIGA